MNLVTLLSQKAREDSKLPQLNDLFNDLIEEEHRLKTIAANRIDTNNRSGQRRGLALGIIEVVEVDGRGVGISPPRPNAKDVAGLMVKMTVHLRMQSVISVIKQVILLDYVHKTMRKMMLGIN